jgi:phage-related protein
VKEAKWMRSSLQDLRGFPEDAQGNLGYGIYLAQIGDKHPHAKPLRGDLAGVTEMISDSAQGNTYRAVYTVKLEPFIYVLHCFEKKSKSGIATPQKDVGLIHRRLKEAKAHNEEYWKIRNAKNI